MGFSYIFSPDSFNNASISEGCIFEMALAVGTVGIMYIYIPRAGKGVRIL